MSVVPWCSHHMYEYMRDSCSNGAHKVLAAPETLWSKTCAPESGKLGSKSTLCGSPRCRNRTLRAPCAATTTENMSLEVGQSGKSCAKYANQAARHVHHIMCAGHSLNGNSSSRKRHRVAEWRFLSIVEEEMRFVWTELLCICITPCVLK